MADTLLRIEHHLTKTLDALRCDIGTVREEVRGLKRKCSRGKKGIIVMYTCISYLCTMYMNCNFFLFICSPLLMLHYHLKVKMVSYYIIICVWTHVTLPTHCRMLLWGSSQPRPQGVDAQHHQGTAGGCGFSTRCTSLAGSMAHLLFTTEKMATQNATPTRTPGIKLLDDCTRRLQEEIVRSLGIHIHRRTPH